MIKVIKNNSPVIIAICAIMMIFIGCGEDTDEEADVNNGSATGAPPLPPDESMNVDMSLFEENLIGAPSTAALSVRNFAYAVTAATTVSSAIVVAITPPATLFAAARLVEPVEQDDGSWLWSFSIKINGVTFGAKLTGTEKLNKNLWSMVVSTDAPLRPAIDFEWYRGESTEMNIAGSWEFFDLQTPTEQNPTVKIDWSVGIVDEEATLTLENVDPRPDSEYSGDVLQYNATLQAASITFNDASKNELWEMFWDIDTGAGSIIAPNYNDGEKACWDSNKRDVVCD